jgi:hypothetical protein
VKKYGQPSTELSGKEVEAPTLAEYKWVASDCYIRVIRGEHNFRLVWYSTEQHEKLNSKATKLGTKIEEIDAEDRAVSTIEKLGGSAYRDEMKLGKPVVVVSFYGTQVTDADLKKLAPLREIRDLNLYGTPVTDEGLKHLAPLKGLTTLSLNSTNVTNAGLKEHALPISRPKPVPKR